MWLLGTWDVASLNRDVLQVYNKLWLLKTSYEKIK